MVAAASITLAAPNRSVAGRGCIGLAAADRCVRTSTHDTTGLTAANGRVLLLLLPPLLLPLLLLLLLLLEGARPAAAHALSQLGTTHHDAVALVESCRAVASCPCSVVSPSTAPQRR